MMLRVSMDAHRKYAKFKGCDGLIAWQGCDEGECGAEGGGGEEHQGEEGISQHRHVILKSWASRCHTKRPRPKVSPRWGCVVCRR